MVDQISGVTRCINRESTSGKTIRKLPLTNRNGLVYWTTLRFLIKLCCYLLSNWKAYSCFSPLLSRYPTPKENVPMIFQVVISRQSYFTKSAINCSFPRPQAQSIFLGAVILVCPSKRVHFITYKAAVFLFFLLPAPNILFAACWSVTDQRRPC